MFTKDRIEFSNSILWFVMDAAWMMEWLSLSLFLIVPTILTGLIICLMEKNRDALCVDLSMFFWIIMNSFWFLSDIHEMPGLLWVSKICFFLGAILLAIAYYFSKDWRHTIKKFRRLRLKT